MPPDITADVAIGILRNAGCEERIISHCIAVRDLALKFLKKSGADKNLVETGALLHDIGRSESHGLDHAAIGADICRNLGLDERVCRIVERHIGAGITYEECIKEGLEPRNYIPESVEEKIVAHADNLIKGRREITIEERLKRSDKLSAESKRRIFLLSEEIEKFRDD
ncbi:HDIG domain-containing metalloprotein [Methanoplanus endosymbiosus]|uniref:HDIG domain-containing protein n=1 Tax=Methanoplanus endosymbiosus TaxID=33865 RepID=A0A9E7PMF5_9EURY|nr:HDIG domain-containing metalloprotein [Methanoplanus endosymbiosus]UUX92903.1 HDIG domain-containing protein [Methanoplanus endosymbiosus]